jgi:hypothetical protein
VHEEEVEDSEAQEAESHWSEDWRDRRGEEDWVRRRVIASPRRVVIGDPGAEVLIREYGGSEDPKS